MVFTDCIALRSMRTFCCTFLLSACSVSAASEGIQKQLDSAQIKMRAGEPDAALRILDDLVPQHGDDPRVHYHRSLVLKELERMQEAADAVSRAVASLESLKKRPQKPGFLGSIENKIEKLADEMLFYRRKARSCIQDLAEEGMKILRQVPSAHQIWGLYIIDSLAKLDDLHELSLSSEREKYSTETCKKYAALRPVVQTEENLSQEKRLLLKQNIEAGNKAFLGRKYEEARICAKAALEIDPGDADAWLLLSDTLARLDNNEKSVAAVLNAIDIPKKQTPGVAATYRKALYKLNRLVPELVSYIKKRDAAAKKISTLFRSASRSKRDYDTQWLGSVLFRLSPGEPSVGYLLSKITLKTTSFPGAVHLTAPDVTWKWVNEGPESKQTGSEVILTNSDPGRYLAQLTCSDQLLSDRYILRFEMRYDLGGKTPPIWITFESLGKVCGFFCIPEGDHNVGFTRLTERGWGVGDKQSFPKGKPVSNKWFQYEIRWNGTTRKLSMMVDGTPAYDHVIDAAEGKDYTPKGVFGIAFCDGRKIQLRNVFLKNM